MLGLLSSPYIVLQIRSLLRILRGCLSDITSQLVRKNLLSGSVDVGIHAGRSLNIAVLHILKVLV